MYNQMAEPQRIEELNIVKLIEENPVTKLSNSYQSKLLNKIKETFTDNEQQMFVASFYCYLNCNQKTDFIIDFNKVWEWMGFTQKVNAKRFLENNFIPDNDYKLLLFPKEEQKKGSGRGGHNKETIMMTVKTFKLFCMKAGTKKSHQVHEYYMKLEELLQELIQEEGNELRLQLEQKDNLLQNHINTAQLQKELLREKTILEQFPHNTQCVYYGIIDNTTSNNESLIKFGNSNFLRDRVEQHKRVFTNFRLVNAFKVENKIQIENAIKKNNTISEKRKSITINNTTYTELIDRDAFSFDQLDNLIKDIIVSVEYSAENYKKLLKDNDKMNKIIMELTLIIDNLKSESNSIDNIVNDNRIDQENKDLLVKNILLQEENLKLRNDNYKLIKRYKLCKDLLPLENTIDMSNNHVSDINNHVSDIDYNNVCNSMKRISKSSDGFYHIGNCKYKKCFGSREEVWNGDAYKTTGELTKSDFIINKAGKIISKKKFIQEKEFNRFENVNLLKKIQN
jgi:hypothetical protein